MTPVTMTILGLVGLTLTSVLAACSDTVEAIDSCAKSPTAKNCKHPDAGSSPATTYGSAPTPVAAPPLPDAGKPDAPVDGAAPVKPKVPPATAACRDLTQCCGKVKDSLEKAGCLAIAIQQNAGHCANAMIAYQLIGCGHSPLKLPDIFNSDKSPNSSKDCSYLESACIDDPANCDRALECDGVSTGGTDTTPEDYCAAADDPCCLSHVGPECGFTDPDVPPIDPPDLPPIDPSDPPVDPPIDDPCASDPYSCGYYDP